MTHFPPTTYRAIGLMSGSSLDGLDMALCQFSQREGKWDFSIEQVSCKAYSPEWEDRLRHARELDGKSLWQLHADFGHFCGQAVHDFIQTADLKNVDLVASHGHTVFHFPDLHFTTQIGDGAALAAEAGLPVICDFRSIDIAKSGQGAPLVPIGDHLLFANQRFLLNIGGIANLSVKHNDGIVAFDICSANQVLNFYAQQKNLAYDRDGALAAKGSLDQVLFDRLNQLDYYGAAYPKSLDNGYSRQSIIPLIEETSLSIEDKLHTFCEHIAYQIGQHIKLFPAQKEDRLLASGGGALNQYLMDRIQHYSPIAIHRPDDKIINYKEALIFAFMGVLRLTNQTNILHTVTGAKTDSIAGAIYLP